MALPVYDPGVGNPFSAGDDFPSTGTGVTLPGSVTAVFADYVYPVEATFVNRVVESWDGHEKRGSQKPLRRRWKIAYEQLTPTDADTLWNHFIAQTGSLTAFTYVDYLSDESFTVRYDMDGMTRETFLFEAERGGVNLVEVL